MTKFVIASHGTLALGLKNTVELFVQGKEVQYFGAYVEGQPEIEEQFEKFFAELTNDQQAVIFTDLYGGSVNQKALLKAGNRENVFIIAGFNLPVILEALLFEGTFTAEKINECLEIGKSGVQFVNQPSAATVTEDDFFA